MVGGPMILPMTLLFSHPTPQHVFSFSLPHSFCKLIVSPSSSFSLLGMTSESRHSFMASLTPFQTTQPQQLKSLREEIPAMAESLLLD